MQSQLREMKSRQTVPPVHRRHFLPARKLPTQASIQRQAPSSRKDSERERVSFHRSPLQSFYASMHSTNLSPYLSCLQLLADNLNTLIVWFPRNQRESHGSAAEVELTRELLICGNYQRYLKYDCFKLFRYDGKFVVTRVSDSQRKSYSRFSKY